MDTERKEGFDRGDPLWDVLGRASKPPAPSPYFARRVLRDLDLDAGGKSGSADGWFAQIRWFRAWMPVAAAIALLVAAGHYWLPSTGRSPEFTLSDDNLLRFNPDQRISVVLADLDELVAFEDNSIGDDETMWQ